MAILIDTRGKACPQPIILTKQAIKVAPENSAFEVMCDNDTARGNLLTYLATLNLPAQCEIKDAVFHIFFSTGNATIEPSDEEAFEQYSCEAPSADNYAMVFRGITMGVGDDKLGALLMRSCINSIASLDKLPQLIVLYNAGVTLAAEGADTAQSIKDLEGSGVEVIVCGTCVDYFELSGKIVTGTISNMLTINNKLSKLSRIIYP